MAKQLLIETKMNALSLCEGVKPKNPGCLGTMAGPCADYDNATRNGNFYSRKLWENVFKDDLVRESLDDKVLLGELDHPGDRLETQIKNACIVMTDYNFDDQNKVLNGTFDILDTPNGRILKSLLDYGCKIGVSSRGEGDVTEDMNGSNVVDEDSYYFVAFDAVALPAVKKAKPALQESVKRKSLDESLISQINSATSKSELDMMKRVIESVNLPDIDSILESINNKSKELEGTAGSSNLVEDLERSNARNRQLEEQVIGLKKEVTASKSRTKRFMNTNKKLMRANDQLSEELESLNESYSDVVFKFSDVSNKLNGMESSSEERIKSLEEALRLKEDQLSSRTKVLMRSNKELTEVNRQLEEEVRNLQNSLSKSQKKLNECIQDKVSAESELKSVKKKLSESDAKRRKLVSEAKVSLRKSESRSVELLKQYAVQKASSRGVSVDQSLLESLKPNMTISQVDKLLSESISRQDRYSKLPVRDDALISSLSEATIRFNKGVVPKSSEEDKQTLEFMESMYKK